MFDPDWEEGCPSCTAGTDELSPGFLEHLHTRDTSYALVSRAPLEKLERWKAKQGLGHLPWYSSGGSDFNYDFGVTDRRVARRRASTTTATEGRVRGLGDDFFGADQPFEMPGRSCFLRVDGRIFHTYSQYARGLESTGGSYYFLDLTALGRQEDWEEPKGRSRQRARPRSPTSRANRRRGRPGPWRRMRRRGAGSAPASDRRRCAGAARARAAARRRRAAPARRRRGVTGR